MSQTIEGVYRNGVIELDQRPAVDENTRVSVTFPPDNTIGSSDPPSDNDRTGEAAVSRMDANGVSHPLPHGPERDKAVKEMWDLIDRVSGHYGGNLRFNREEFYEEVLEQRLGKHSR